MGAFERQIIIVQVIKKQTNKQTKYSRIVNKQLWRRNSTYRTKSFLKRFIGVTGIRVMLFTERSLKEIVMQFSKAVFPKVIRWNLLQDQPTVSKTRLGCTLSSSKSRCSQLVIQSDNVSVQFFSLKKQYRKYRISLVDNCLDVKHPS